MAELQGSPELYSTILRVKNLEHSMQWYHEVLGLQPANHDTQYQLVNMVGTNGQRITLRELSADRQVHPMGLNGAYVVFVTPSADAAHAEMARRGEKVSPVQDHPGVRLFWLTDPDGHSLCILEFVIDWVG